MYKFDSFKTEIPLPQAVVVLNDLFNLAGIELFAVGGVVRDYLHSLYHGSKFDPKDVDLATEADPSEVSRVLRSTEAKALGITCFPKGEAFGVISAVMGGKEYEIATFRDEYYDPKGDGRHPDKVTFSTPGWDAARRDLTFNALFYDMKAKEIRDYNLNEQGLGQGFEDIKNLVARPIGNARDRFREDKLRIPRLVRFFCRFNSGNILESLDGSTVAAVQEFRDMKGVSPERIVNEFFAGLAKAISPVAYVKNYDALGLMPAVFPGLKVDIHEVERIGNCRNPKAILAWLLKSNDNIRNKLNDLKYANDVSDRVNFLVKLLQGGNIVPLLKLRDLHKQLKEGAEAVKAEMGQDVRNFGQMVGMEVEYFLSYQPIAKAQDFLHLKGKAIADAMAELENRNYKAGV